MGRLSNLPGWVRRPIPVVAGVEDLLLWVFGQTGSPEALGSRVALAWVGGLEVESPMIHRVAEPTQPRLAGEFHVAVSISTNESFPGWQWRADHNIPAGDVPSPAFWDAHASYGSTRSYAHGVAVALIQFV